MTENSATKAELPDISLIMPCYNEQDCVANTVRRLFTAFSGAGFRLEIVAVDNGSGDDTGKILRELAVTYPDLRIHRVAVNQGYGNGILSGIPHGTAEWIGFIPADGQVDATDVVELYETLVTARGRVLGKVRRRFRMDGLQRKLISISYNLLVKMLWPRLQSLDVNGTPKILRRVELNAMDLQSRGWFLDPEMMIKAHYMGLRVLELNAFARMRGNGISHVRTSTCWEFLRNLMVFRFSSQMRRWRQQNRRSLAAAPEAQLQLAASESGADRW